MKFGEACRRLMATYEAGDLVPFLGAGMSVPACADWPGFIGGLERRAQIVSPAADDDPAALIRRANRAVRTLKLRDPDSFPTAVGDALAGTADGVPRQTDALAKTWWPLVLTTNYDPHFYDAFRAAHGKVRLLVRGRGPRHCQDVLSSLTTPSDPILWALQGFLPRPDLRLDDVPVELSRELVIGHEEYRRVTHREQHFRKAFAEVYRRRSLLFLGSGLKESYLLELFGEILEFYGANPLYHYAFVKEGEVDADFLLARFNTIVVEYASHPELPALLEELNAALLGRRPRTIRWDYSLDSATRVDDISPEVSDLSIVRGRLPLPDRRTKECAAISAGGGPGAMFLSGAMQRYVMRAGALGHIKTVRAHRLGDSEIWRYGKSPLFAIVAREPGDIRDVRAISRAVREFCSIASESYALARMQLLGAGRGRSFPARFSLIEIVRGFADWRRANPTSTFRISIHVVAPDVLFDLTTRRVDIVELLTCDEIRFWVEIALPNGDVERHLQHCAVEAPVVGVARRFDIPRSWRLEIIPSPQVDERPTTVAELAPDQTIQGIGVVPGCTLRFARR